MERRQKPVAVHFPVFKSSIAFGFVSSESEIIERYDDCTALNQHLFVLEFLLLANFRPSDII